MQQRLGSRTLMFFICVLALGSASYTLEQTESTHRNRFTKYADRFNIRDIGEVDLTRLSPAGEPIKIIVTPNQGQIDASSPRSTLDYLRAFGCAADAVVTATPRAARSDFTAEGTFIFTAYDADLESVLRGHTVLPASKIVVLWPGGSLMHKGRSIIALDPSYPPLATGRKYLLFLHQIAEGEFETIPAAAGYDLTGRQAKSLNAGTLRESVNSNSLVALAQAAVGDCNK